MAMIWKGALGVLGLAVASGIGMNIYMKGQQITRESVQLAKLAQTQLVQLTDKQQFITNPLARQTITAESIWNDSKGTCVMIIRRPGCMLCREEARDLKNLFEKTIQNNNNNIKLVGIVKEELGVSEFYNDYFPFEIYLDESKTFYNEINGRSIGLLGFLMPDSYTNGNRAKSKGIKGNMVGEGTILGGLLCVKNGNEINYVYNERVWGDHAPLNEVENALNEFMQQPDVTTDTTNSKL